MKLEALASTVPDAVLTQEECWHRLVQSHAIDTLRPGSRHLLEKFLLNDNGIDQRHLAVHDMKFLAQASPGDLNQIFEKEAPALAEAALRKAMEKASLSATDLDAIFICTCTGYLCPGISSYVAEQLGLRANVFLNDLVGHGCGAAIPLLHSADAYLTAHPTHRVACVAVEVCSAAFYIDDDPGVLVSLALFGDGASASIWQSDMNESTTGLWQIGEFQTVHHPAARDTLRFVNENGYLKNKLHRSVPQTVGTSVAQLFNELKDPLPQHILSHSGGRDVLEAVEAAVPGHTLSESRQILRNFGNMSSPSVLFALEQYLETPSTHSDLWLVSFGAGFTCHAARLKKGV
jgi:alkylresorcinol/alkylpyrone synthase